MTSAGHKKLFLKWPSDYFCDVNKQKMSYINGEKVITMLHGKYVVYKLIFDSTAFNLHKTCYICFYACDENIINIYVQVFLKT